MKLLLIILLSGLTMVQDSAGRSAGLEIDRLTVYHIGNSLTRNIPLERLQALFASAGIQYEYGMQLGGGHQLDQHLVKRNHNNKPGEGRYNTREPFGEYDHAFKNFHFDAVVLQPYNSVMDQEPKVTDRLPYYEAGAFQSAKALIEYASGRTKAGTGAWHLENPNTTNQASDQFYIYATWPRIDDIQQSGAKTYAEYYHQEFDGGTASCEMYFQKLVNMLNQSLPELENPVRLIPAGQVLAVLDQKIRQGELPGIEAFYQRNQDYYKKARRNNNSPAPYDPEYFEREQGVLNFYADNVHMNDQPHNGEDSGTIGSYVAALTLFTVLSGQSPLGLTADPYEMFDPAADRELIRVLQEIVWQVVTNEPLTEVKK